MTPLRQQHSQQQPVALLVATLLLPKAAATGSQLRQLLRTLMTICELGKEWGDPQASVVEAYGPDSELNSYLIVTSSCAYSRAAPYPLGVRFSRTASAPRGGNPA